MVTTDKIFQTLVIGNPPERAYIKYYVLSQRKCAQVYIACRRHCFTGCYGHSVRGVHLFP